MTFEARYFELDRLDFSKGKVIEANYDLIWMDARKNIEIIQNAIEATKKEIIKAIDEDATMRHREHMVHTLRKQYRLLKYSIPQNGTYYSKEIFTFFDWSIQDAELLFEPIRQIILEGGFNKREQKLLTRPYVFNFETQYIQNYNHIVSEVREKLIAQMKPLIESKELSLNHMLVQYFPIEEPDIQQKKACISCKYTFDENGIDFKVKEAKCADCIGGSNWELKEQDFKNPDETCISCKFGIIENEIDIEAKKVKCAACEANSNFEHR